MGYSQYQKFAKVGQISSIKLNSIKFVFSLVSLLNNKLKIYLYNVSCCLKFDLVFNICIYYNRFINT